MTRKLIRLRNFFSDKDGKLAMWQKPNIPLICWFVFLVLSHLLPAGNWRAPSQVVSKAAIIIWALLEMYSGASPFRRVLGLIVLILSIAPLL
jgi:phosphoglycerol transferase MdoB-like AlkP superfamily enzyme